MRKRKSSMRALLAIALLAMLAPGLAAAGTDLRIGVASGPKALHPYAVNINSTNSVNRNIYDSLLWYEAENFTPQPLLAEKWEAIDDKTWIFHLRKGVAFHDGTPFTARDVKFSVEHCGTWDKSGHKSTVKQIEGVEIIDDYTVKVLTRKPYGILPGMVSRLMIMSEAYVAQHGIEHSLTHPNGTGAYKLEKWVRGDYLSLVANPDYWGAAPDVKTVVIKPLSNDATRTAAILSGEVQIIEDVPVNDVPRLRADDGLDIVSISGLRVIYYGMDLTRDESPKARGKKGENPLKDIRVRKALAMAINENAIVKHIMKDLAFPASNMYPQMVAGYDESLKRPPYDPVQAKKLLAEAGYPDGFELTIDGPNDRYVNDEKILETTAAMLAKIGIKVKVNARPMKTYLPAGHRGEYSFYLLGWACGPPDAARWLDSIGHSKDGKGWGKYNLGMYSNPRVDMHIEAASATVDGAERISNMMAAQRIILQEDVAFIPLHHQVDVYAKTKNIKWVPGPDHLLRLNTITLE